MAGSKILRVALLAALSALSVSAGPVERRQECVATCGTTCYWQTSVDEAVDAGYDLFQSGDTVGSNDYPHTFNNREGFDFAVSGPYQEFPILDSFDPYTGGDPSTDRVVFNENGEYAGSITHTGASGNNFVACT
ncbi:hypothetical protein MGN70_008390 [Eutypa lata]|uniref:ribonuclease T1 n=1 Tax=Eutypa lata (strain UCR-EL1) TaxID=1287681 RepID=M7TGQ3_EUTLA|nr:putative extracellular guanyl-specific ribonuclease protein [Eutypa lata UCREL1]KAI1249940.1 hypothetical protein MGN70_008390 [Eutypa lata]